MDAGTVWRAAPRTVLLVSLFIGMALVVPVGLAVLLWARAADRVVAAGLVLLGVAAAVYGWRFGLHPRMAVADGRLVVTNPWRTVVVPLDAIRSVEPGINGLRVSTDADTCEVWCVQKSTSAIRAGRRERADAVADALRERLRPARVDAPDSGRPRPQSEIGPEPDDEPELLIRRATRADVGTLAGLEREACGESSARWDRMLGERRVRARLAELDGAQVGYLAYRDDQIECLGVLPSHQGRGFGSQLLAYATRDILRDHDSATLWVLRDDVRARDFYRAHGFVDTGEERLGELAPQPVQTKMILATPR